MNAPLLPNAALYPRRVRTPEGVPLCPSQGSTHRRFESAEAVARAMRLESVRRLASLEASVRQLSLWNAEPDQSVLDEIEGLRAGIALLDEMTEPLKKEFP